MSHKKFMWMQQKTTAESEHNLKAFCRPVTLTDSRPLTFIHLFTLCFQLWFVPMAHALRLSLRPLHYFFLPVTRRFQGWIVFFLFQKVSGVLKENAGVDESSVAGEFLPISVSCKSTIKLDLSQYILLRKTRKDKTFTWIRVHVFMLEYFAQHFKYISKISDNLKTLHSIKNQCKEKPVQN